MIPCECCGSTHVTTGGCLLCTSTRMFCGCGALLRCGCGRTNKHECPNVIKIASMFKDAPVNLVLPDDWH